MRMPNVDENLIGKVCVCSVGRVAIVTGQKEFPFGLSWTGVGLDGKGTWASKQPCVVAESGADFHDVLLARFDGKMSRNS